VASGKFQKGDVVEIVTLDRGRRGPSYNKRPQRTVERWRAVVLMPSPVSSGWWIVKKFSGKRLVGRTYTVPQTEMAHVQRDSPSPPQRPIRQRRPQG
jgi:hypothetical protein